MNSILSKTLFFLFAAGIVASPAAAQDFRLSSTSVAEGAKLAPAQIFDRFGCDGGNSSPQLA